MAKVINSYGTEINYNAAVELMDDELREEVHADLAPCTEQEFFDEYARRHAEHAREQARKRDGEADEHVVACEVLAHRDEDGGHLGEHHRRGDAAREQHDDGNPAGSLAHGVLLAHTAIFACAARADYCGMHRRTPMLALAAGLPMPAAGSGHHPNCTRSPGLT